MCTSTFGKIWTLKPKVLYQIYTNVVRPTETYAATVWWSTVKLKISKPELQISKVYLLGNHGSNENNSHKSFWDSLHCICNSTTNVFHLSRDRFQQ
jgi:hypothetical protein